MPKQKNADPKKAQADASKSTGDAKKEMELTLKDWENAGKAFAKAFARFTELDKLIDYIVKRTKLVKKFVRDAYDAFVKIQQKVKELRRRLATADKIRQEVSAVMQSIKTNVINALGEKKEKARKTFVAKVNGYVAEFRKHVQRMVNELNSVTKSLKEMFKPVHDMLAKIRKLPKLAQMAMKPITSRLEKIAGFRKIDELAKTVSEKVDRGINARLKSVVAKLDSANEKLALSAMT